MNNINPNIEAINTLSNFSTNIKKDSNKDRVTALRNNLYICVEKIKKNTADRKEKYDAHSFSWKTELVSEEIRNSNEIYNHYANHLFEQFSELFPQNQEVGQFLTEKFTSKSPSLFLDETSFMKFCKFTNKLERGELKSYDEKKQHLLKKIEIQEAAFIQELTDRLSNKHINKKIIAPLNSLLNELKTKNPSVEKSKLSKEQLESFLNSLKDRINDSLSKGSKEINIKAFKEINWESLFDPNHNNYLSSETLLNLNRLKNQFEYTRNNASNLQKSITKYQSLVPQINSPKGNDSINTEETETEKTEVKDQTDSTNDKEKVKKDGDTKTTKSSATSAPLKKKRGFFSSIGRAFTFFPRLLWKGIKSFINLFKK